MIADGGIKTHNAIAYFAHTFVKYKGVAPTPMWIYKLLALLEFRFLKQVGRPSLGLKYKAFKNGPVPVEIYEMQDRIALDVTYGLYEFQKEKNAKGQIYYYVNPKAKPDLDYFSDLEVDIMDSLCDDFIVGGKTLEDLIDVTHEEMRSWQVAWTTAEQLHRKSMDMSWIDEFPGLDSKKEDELSPVEEAFLVHCGCLQLEEESFAD